MATRAACYAGYAFLLLANILSYHATTAFASVPSFDDGTYMPVLGATHAAAFVAVALRYRNVAHEPLGSKAAGFAAVALCIGFALVPGSCSAGVQPGFVAGTVLIGSSRRFVGMDTTPHPAVMQAIAQRAKHFFPSFSGVKLIRAYAGVRPASPDGKPIISPTHVEGVYVAAGHEGNGIGLSLITGKLVSQMLRGETPLVDLAPLCIDRFGMNPPSLPSA